MIPARFHKGYYTIKVNSMSFGNWKENLEYLQDNTLQHAILVEMLLTKVGQQGRDSLAIVRASLAIVTYFLR